VKTSMTAATGSALLTNKIGLHARPSVKLTQLAKQFAADLEVATNDEGPWFDAKSPVKMMRLKASLGETLYFRAQGEGAHLAVTQLIDLVNGKFGEAH
jgi:phosphocarrier protein HPr